MNRKERRKLQKHGVQVPKDPALSIKLSALGKAVMTPEMNTAMPHEINQQCLEADERLSLDVDAVVLWTLHRHLGFGVNGCTAFIWLWQQSTAECATTTKWTIHTPSATSSKSWALT